MNHASRLFAGWVLAAVRRFGWLPVAYFVFHLLAVFVLRLYAVIPHLDVYMHAGGGAVIAWFFRGAIDLPEAEPVMGQLTPLGRDLWAWTALGTAVVAWEGAEWITDRLGLTRWQLSIDDTIADMGLGVTAGTILLVVGAALRARRAA